MISDFLRKTGGNSKKAAQTPRSFEKGKEVSENRQIHVTGCSWF
jgi:hypothetical protein